MTASSVATFAAARLFPDPTWDEIVTAVAGAFHIRATRRYFSPTPADSASVFARLRLGMSFDGGDSAIAERGMSLLAAEMVSDYRRDAEEDVFLKKYNPISAGDWDYETVVADLKRKIEAVDCPEMDAIMSVDTAPEVLWL